MRQHPHVIPLRGPDSPRVQQASARKWSSAREVRTPEMSGNDPDALRAAEVGNAAAVTSRHMIRVGITHYVSASHLQPST
jgi:hypothetical protein